MQLKLHTFGSSLIIPAQILTEHLSTVIVIKPPPPIFLFTHNSLVHSSFIFCLHLPSPSCFIHSKTSSSAVCLVHNRSVSVLFFCNQHQEIESIVPTKISCTSLASYRHSRPLIFYLSSAATKLPNM